MLGKLKLYAIAGAAFALGLLGIYWRGRSAEAVAAERERLDSYVETRKRMDEVGRMSDADASRVWLRARNK